MAVTLVANVFVAWYERREGRRLGSPYLIADAAHTRSDIYVTMGVVLSFAGARANLPWMDGLVAAGIAVFIAFLAVQILDRILQHAHRPRGAAHRIAADRRAGRSRGARLPRHPHARR